MVSSLGLSSSSSSSSYGRAPLAQLLPLPPLPSSPRPGLGPAEASLAPDQGQDLALTSSIFLRAEGLESTTDPERTHLPPTNFFQPQGVALLPVKLNPLRLCIWRAGWGWGGPGTLGSWPVLALQALEGPVRGFPAQGPWGTSPLSCLFIPTVQLMSPRNRQRLLVLSLS